MNTTQQQQVLTIEDVEHQIYELCVLANASQIFDSEDALKSYMEYEELELEEVFDHVLNHELSEEEQEAYKENKHYEGLSDDEKSDYQHEKDIEAVEFQVEEELGDYVKIVRHLIEHQMIAVDKVQDYIEENRLGITNNLIDWVVEFLDESDFFRDASEEVKKYFDYESYVRDMKLSGDIFTIEKDGQIFVFNNN